MTLSLKRTLEPNIYGLIVVGVIAYFMTCNGNVNEKKQPAEPYSKWARAVSLVGTGDTTKPKMNNQLYLRKIDTLNVIMDNYLGHSLTVDVMSQLKTIFFRITNELKSDTAHGK